MTEEIDPQRAAVVMDIDTPMTITLKDHRLTLRTFMHVYGQSESVLLDLEFSRNASGALCKAIVDLHTAGGLTFTEKDAPPLQ